MMIKIKKIANQKNKKGFSFLEVIISTFIFSLIIVVAVSAFVSSFSTRKTVRTEQRNLEEARTAMETMAKNIRMSSSLTVSDDDKTIKMLNNSQSVCLQYSFSNNKLIVAKANFDPDTDVPSNCSNGIISYGTATELISIPVDGKFNVIPSVTTDPPGRVIGKATVSINIGTGSELQNIQTTVSFRDYSEVLP